jgi:predicted nucleic acid-binding Zn ribbon protein
VNQEPKPLKDALAELSRTLKLPEPSAYEQVAALWNELVGPAVAEHAKVASVRDGMCTIEVDGPAWATQCKYLESDLVERAANALGPGRVTSVRIAVRGPGRDR